MRLRIAHVSATFPPYAGGTGNVCLGNALELARRGHRVDVFTAAMSSAPAHEELDTVRVHRLRPLIRMGNAPLLPRLLLALSGFDVIHLHYPFFGGEGAAIAARIHGIPLVVTYHHDVVLSGPLRFVERALRYSLGAMTFRFAARILFTSEDYAAASHARPLLHRTLSSLGVLPNGVDTAAFEPGPPPPRLRARHLVGKGDRVALLVSALDPMHAFKGVHVFMRALARSPKWVRGIIVGDGELRREYETLAADMSLGDRLAFTGRVSFDELRNYYRLADVTVLPSTTVGEAFGVVLLESLASGTPVVASDLPGVRTVVDDRRDGLLVPPGDARALASAIVAITGDKARCREMGRLGREKVLATYGWKAVGDRLESIYYELVDLSA